MLLTRKQFIVVIAVMIISIGCWAMLLKMAIDSSLELKWPLFIWFFGGCLVAFCSVGAWLHFGEINVGRRKEDIKIDGDIHEDFHDQSNFYDQLQSMRGKISDIKTAAKKGLKDEI